MRSSDELRALPLYPIRFFLIRTAVLSLFSLLAARLVYVQAVLRTELQDKARRFAPVNPEVASRYPILDRNRIPLAESVQVYSCFIDPSVKMNRRVVAHEVAPVLGMDAETLLRRLKAARGSFLWIKRNVPFPAVAALKKKNLPGVGFKREMRRHYPAGPSATHLLGLVGVDGRGLSGMEQAFEKILSRSDPPAAHAASDDLPHGRLQLTVDADLQQVVERELDWGVKKTEAKGGTAVVQDPWTGEILAMATWPPLSLNPDDPPDSKNLRIPVVTDVFEPGSTFKIVTAAAAIEEELVLANEVFDGERGAWKISGITIHDHDPLKKMTFDDMMIHSSNIGVAKLGERIGSGRLYQYARLFGFGVYPGSNIPGEAKGMLRVPAQWSGVSKHVVSFGQEVGVTALQIVGAYSAVANGGVLMEPSAVKAILSNDDDVLWRASPSAVRRVVSAETAAELTRILTKAVEKGTGQMAQVRWSRLGKVAGKTGTAQKFDAKRGGYRNDLTLVSFCGFFPADAPRLTLLVIVDEPSGRRWGGLDAAPIFRRIAEQAGPRFLPAAESARERKDDKRLLALGKIVKAN